MFCRISREELLRRPAPLELSWPVGSICALGRRARRELGIADQGPGLRKRNGFKETSIIICLYLPPMSCLIYTFNLSAYVPRIPRCKPQRGKAIHPVDTWRAVLSLNVRPERSDGRAEGNQAAVLARVSSSLRIPHLT